MKKEYIAPKMESIDLKNKGNLILCGSSDIGGDTAFVSYKQDPIA